MEDRPVPLQAGQDAELNAVLDALGAALLEAGLDLETLIEDSREIRGELLAELYGIALERQEDP